MHNLAFSRNFSDVRKLIKRTSQNAWFSFYGRIPAGLFSGDVRVRNCVLILDKTEDNRVGNYHTTKLHRWFSEGREYLFPKLHYTTFTFNDIIPMFSSSTLREYFENSRGKELSYYIVRESNYELHFKQSAYNWIAVSRKPAPCFDKNEKKILQSQVSKICFKEKLSAQLSILLLNGRLFFSHWLSYGDEFHVTKDDISSIRVPYDLISQNDKKVLQELSVKFDSEINETIQYKLNAGKKVGTYNTSKLWSITDISDKIFLNYLCNKPDDVFEAILSHVSQTVISITDDESYNE